MPKMVAYCGLVCSDCPTFLATKNNDDAAREKTAAMYVKKFGFEITPEEINCEGCLAVGGRLLGYCGTCKIRKCCSEKGLENCAVCDEQPCEHLDNFHNFSSWAKASYDRLKEKSRPCAGNL